MDLSYKITTYHHNSLSFVLARIFWNSYNLPFKDEKQLILLYLKFVNNLNSSSDYEFLFNR